METSLKELETNVSILKVWRPLDHITISKGPTYATDTKTVTIYGKYNWKFVCMHLYELANLHKQLTHNEYIFVKF